MSAVAVNLLMDPSNTVSLVRRNETHLNATRFNDTVTGQDAYFHVPGHGSHHGSSGKHAAHAYSLSVKLIVYGAAGLIVFIAILSAVLYLYRRKAATKRPSSVSSGLSSTSSEATITEMQDRRIRSAV